MLLKNLQKLTAACLAGVFLQLMLWTPTAWADVTKNPLRDAYYGDLHVHTSWSFDAFTQNNRTTPQDAYDFAKGGTIKHPVGYDIKLRKPLDFYTVTDHSEYMGVMPKFLNPDDPLLSTATGKDLQKLLGSGKQEDLFAAFAQIGGSVVSGKPLPDLADPAVSSTIWQEIVKIADANYEPGKFTTFPAYEWTSNGPTGYQNLHRNIIFRDSDKVPEMPFSNFDSSKPEDLWNFMDDLREEGVTLLAIPHNPNLSDGLMFPQVDSYGKPLTKEYAQQRMRNEPVVEATQIKGTSETNPLLSDTDEFADFEISDFKLDPDAIGTARGQAKGSYIRDAYKMGLVFEESTGANPYKFGMVAATDTHNTGSPIEEDNYFGKLGTEDGTPEVRLGEATGGMSAMIQSWGSSGVAGAWADSNTREDIYDAFVRKETFATTGPRIRVRLFGGWDFAPADATSNDFVKIGYDKGVPMGGDMAAKPATAQAPSFLVWAMKDSDSGNLDRIQIIKGWSKNGQSYEQVYDVALADGRKVDPNTGKAPSVGNTVNLAKATYENSIGDAQLAAYWSDPDFDPSERAFYYARVLEIPTPRWSTYDAVRLGIPIPAGLPPTIQERAFTSPIWYTPPEALLEQARASALTVNSLKAQGAKELNTRQIKALIVDKRVKIKNLATDEVLEAFYRPDGKRTLDALSGFASSHGSFGGITNPYTIENNMLSSSFDDGSKFSSRIFELNGQYYGAKSDEAGYVNYEVVAIE
jgi:hypothetical protein